MDKLIMKSHELVRNNIKGEFNDTLVELLSDAVLALILIKPTITLEKMPEILGKLNIIADERNVLDIAHDDLGDYKEDEQLKRSIACVIRQFSFDNDNFEEIRHLLVTVRNNYKYVDIICTLIHELTHLLRFSGATYKKDDEELNTKDGLNINTYDFKNGDLKRRNQYLEEGVVQFYANMAIKELEGYIRDLDVSEFKTLDSFKNEISSKNLNSYLLQTRLIEQLSYDMNFLEFLDETFEEIEIHSHLERYFNDVMRAGTAFSEFSRLIDDIYIGVMTNDSITDLNKSCGILYSMVQKYFSNLKKQNKYSK